MLFIIYLENVSLFLRVRVACAFARLCVVCQFQVARFVEALFSRCAADVLAGRSEEDSAPLRLLSDASFYEIEAVAERGA